MSGKALLILVIGFTVIFLVMGYFWGGLATRSTENHVSYYKTTIAHNIAVSGANIGLHNVIADSEWVSDITDRPFENGLMNVTISPLGPSQRTLKSVGTFMLDTQIVKVKLMRDKTSLAKYAWFIAGNLPNHIWITGDTVWGAFHSNEALRVYGNPVYTGKVTTLKGIKDESKSPNPPSNPEFLGGYEDGIDVDWSKSMHYPEYGTIAGSGSTFNKDLWLVFNSDGKVTYRVQSAPQGGQDSSNYSAPITVPLETLAPDGVIYVDGANVYLSGTLKGHVTVVAEQSSGLGGGGNVYLEGDMIYETDPMIPNGQGGYMINPASLDANGNPKDIMGIVATNNITVSTEGNLGGYQNNVVDKDIHIDAGIFCNSGGFFVQDLGKSPANVPLGSIYLQGSMTAGKEEIVAKFNGTVTAGYNRNVIFDERFAIGPPTWFPYLDYYRVISWLE